MSSSQLGGNISTSAGSSQHGGEGSPSVAGSSLLQERLRERKNEGAAGRKMRRGSAGSGAMSSPVTAISAGGYERRPSSSGVGMGVKSMEEVSAVFPG